MTLTRPRSESDVEQPEAHDTVTVKRTRRFSWFFLLGWAFTAVVLFFILYPLLRTFFGVAGVDEDGWQLLRVFEVWTMPEAWQSLGNLLLCVSVGGISALLVGSFLAWVNVRSDARIGWAADILPLVPLFVPAIAASVGWVFLASPKAGMLNVWVRDILGAFGVEMTEGPFDIFTYPGLIFVYFLFLTPYAYLAVSNGLLALDPSLEEAARVSGLGPFKTVFKIVLPNLVPALGAAILQVLTIGFALFAAPVVIGTAAGIEVLPVSVVYAVTRQIPMNLEHAVGLSLMLILLVVLATTAMRKLVDKGNFAKIGGRGSRDNLIKLGKWRWPARLVMVAYLALTSVLPFIGILMVSLQGFWGANFNWSAITFVNYEAIFNLRMLRSGLLNSLMLGLLSATILALGTALIAYLINRRNTKVNRAIDASVKVPAAVSHIVMGLSFLVAFSRPPFDWTGTLFILVAVYVVIFLPQASLYANSAVQQIGDEMIEAAEVSGAGPGRVFLRIVLPLMAPSLVSAWALVFVLGASEVNASSMLSGAGTPVAGMIVLDLFNNGTYPRLAAIAVVISVISTAVVLIVLSVKRRLARR